jgi:hypothetical protein
MSRPGFVIALAMMLCSGAVGSRGFLVMVAAVLCWSFGIVNLI